MKITGAIITGGGGFLGSHLADQLLSQDIPVVCIDNFCTGLRSNRDYLESKYLNGKIFQFLEKDVIQNWDDWISEIHRNILEKVSHVFHFASPASPPHYQKLSLETMWVNTWALNHAIKFADSIKARVIFASTSEIYGDPSISPQPESYWGNVNTIGFRSCYDEAKRFGESLIFTHNLRNQTQHGMVRIFNTYGPRMNPGDGRVIINFLVQAKKGLSLSILGDGQQTRSFCYVDDLVKGIFKYAESNITTPMNVGNDREFTILELAKTVQKIYQNKKLLIDFFPLPSDDPKQRMPDLTKIKNEFPDWRPQIQLEEGLRHLDQWLDQVDLTHFQLPERPR